MALDAATELLRRLYEKQVETVLKLDELAASGKSKLGQCKLIDLQFVKTFALTVGCRYDAAATGALKVHILTSPHGGVFDTDDFATMDLPVTAGKQEQKTAVVSPEARYLKVTVENVDAVVAVYDVYVTVTY